MNGHYLILVGDKFNRPDRVPTVLDAALHAAGMTCRLRTASVSVFASAETPTLAVPGHGLIVGRLFSSTYTPITRLLDFDGTADELILRLLQNTWGEYLAVFTDGKDGRELTLLRDPSGAVPCVYSLDDGEGFVTSDIGLATRLGLYRREVDWQVIAHSLSFPYLRTARTGLKQVSELLPGSTLTCGGSTITTQAAWSPWRFVAPGVRHTDPRVAAEEVRDAVSGATRALSSLDDRLLVELSGGLDSSIVATCLRESGARATFCTLVMPVAGTDERPYAKLVTDAMGRQLVPVEVGFENVRFEFAVLSSAVMPAIGIMQHAVNAAWEKAGNRYEVDSFFSGGGGDTVFCYLTSAAPAADALRECGASAGLAAIRNLSALHQCTTWKAGKLTLRKLLRKSHAVWRADSTLLDPAWVPAAPDHHPWFDAPPGALPGDRERINDLLGTRLFRDATPRGDGRAMHFPLLSQPVIEACLKVPTWMWIADGRNRSIARDAFADCLPHGILDRRSKGSYTGYMATVYARNRTGMRRFLEQGQLCAHGLLDRSALVEFFAREQAARDLSFLRIFDLCAAENWVRRQCQAPP